MGIKRPSLSVRFTFCPVFPVGETQSEPAVTGGVQVNVEFRGEFSEEARCAVFRTSHRKSTPRVVNGKVQRKDRFALTPTYFNTPQFSPVIDRLKPGFGYRHILKKKDVLAFIELLPDWKELSMGLNAVLLAPGEENTAGWHRPGVVAVCAWDRGLWNEV